MAQEYELFASAARGAGAAVAGSSIYIGGYRKRVELVFDLTAAATENTDTLDLYVDVSPDGTKWLNAVHFGQVLGNIGAAKTEFAVLDSTNPGTATVVATSDAAVSTVRPGAWGKYLRGRYTIVDAGGAAASFTFSLKAYVQ